ncbi:MAG TPA: hypothetical protein VMS18_00615 [Candidatus Binatia bacterium]|nr:hypothetical protein [Candidatus Binatia bacterium]
MSNGDPLRIGVDQPPDNRATSATVLVHNGSVFGTQSSAFWVQRLGAPIATSAIRGDNFSTGPAIGQQVTGVMGMVQPQAGMIGVLGTAAAGQNIMWGETGVMGVTNTFGVVGQGLGSVLEEDGKIVTSSVGVLGQCDDGIGVQGVATTGFGIIGQSVERAGVTGVSESAAGVEARSDNFHAMVAVAQGGVGAYGVSTDGSGVLGESSTGVGVEATTYSGIAAIHGSALRGYGVWAESAQGVGILSHSPTNAIQGVSDGARGASIGVAGISDQGAGVQGDSNYIGVAGRSTQGVGGWFTGRIGVFGDSPAGYAIVGRSAQGVAGLFLGSVVVQGSLNVTGAKSAVVKHKDGSYRTLFCVESAESMLQDFGEVVIKGASVRVKLRADFAPLIKRSGYQVFLTSYGPETPYVRKRTSNWFEIARVSATGKSDQPSLRVGYSIVARRGDLPNNRLPKVQLPRELARISAPKIQRIVRQPAVRRKLNVHVKPLPPRPKIATPDLKKLSESAPPLPATTRNRAKQ